MLEKHKEVEACKNHTNYFAKIPVKFDSPVNARPLLLNLFVALLNNIVFVVISVKISL